MNIEWFRLELNDVERELTSREVVRETSNRLSRSIKNALRDGRLLCEKRAPISTNACKRANAPCAPTSAHRRQEASRASVYFRASRDAQLDS